MSAGYTSQVYIFGFSLAGYVPILKKLRFTEPVRVWAFLCLTIHSAGGVKRAQVVVMFALAGAVRLLKALYVNRSIKSRRFLDLNGGGSLSSLRILEIPRSRPGVDLQHRD